MHRRRSARLMISEESEETEETLPKMAKLAGDDQLNHTCGRNEDFFNMYKNHTFYDCTFKVGTNEEDLKVYKCHRLILAAVSPVFSNMFFGSFKEASMGPDEEIVLNSIYPTAFDLAMQFVYGGRTNFGEVSAAAAIFKFADQMQISSLMKAAEIYIKAMADPDDILAIYDTFKVTNFEAGLEWSWEIVRHNTSQALKSECWLKVSAETVVDLLNSKELAVKNEVVIFEALYRWGKKQAEKEEGKEPDLQEVISVLQSHIKLIRFSSMTLKEFAHLDINTNILTVEEKYAILLSLTLETPDLLPEGFSREKRENLKNHLIFSVPMIVSCPRDHYGNDEIFKFRISEEAYLVGLQVDQSIILHSFTILIDSDDYSDYYSAGNYGHSSSGEKMCLAGKEYFAVGDLSLLEPNTTYTISFDVTPASENDNDVRGQFQQTCKIEQNLLSLEIHPQVCLKVTELVFRLKSANIA